MKNKELNADPEANKEKFAINYSEIHQIVFEKINDVLKEAGIPINEEIKIKGVRGEDSNSVFRIDCGNSTYALKIFSDSENAGGFYTNKYFNQVAMENGVSLPKIIYSSDGCDLLPAPWIIWDWFSGRQSCDLESETDRSAAAIKTGELLRKIHEIKMPGFGSPDNENEWSGENVEWTIDFFIKRIKGLMERGGTAFSENELSDILSVTAESKELSSFTEPCLLHGDITGGNVIVSDSKEITFIDPGEIIAGDPMSDLGYSQTTRLSPIFREGVWQGYTKNTPLTMEEYDRFLRWRLLRQCVIACRAVLNKDKNANNYLEDAKSFLKEIKEQNLSK